jgi:hypothetical protein
VPRPDQELEQEQLPELRKLQDPEPDLKQRLEREPHSNQNQELASKMSLEREQGR